jgi:putative tryptophan/tyrosine transport system substrate-binding protein
MAAVNDPIEQGIVSSLAHPDGNITGFVFIDFPILGKWLEILKEAAPGVCPRRTHVQPGHGPPL